MGRIPKLNQLQAFQSVIQHGSFRAAANALNQSQPVLTRALRDLEETMGAPLFVRGANGITLTEMGRLFRPRMQLILNELSRAIDEVEQVKYASQGSVSFGSSYLLTLDIIPKVIRIFHKKFPHINIDINEGQLSELVSDLRIRQLDFFVGVVNDNISLGGFTKRHLMTSEFCVVCRQGHELEKCTSLIELREAKWFLPKARAGYYSTIDEILFPNGRGASSSVITGNSTIIAEELILDDGYLSIASMEIFKIPFLKDLLSIIPIKEPLPTGDYSLIYNQCVPLTPVAQLFIDEILQYCGK